MHRLKRTKREFRREVQFRRDKCVHEGHAAVRCESNRVQRFATLSERCSLSDYKEGKEVRMEGKGWRTRQRGGNGGDGSVDVCIWVQL